MINYPKYITHIGVLVENDSIISKWAWGPTLQHNIFDVPLSYSSEIKYIKKISKERALDLYHKYKNFNYKQQ